MTWHAIRIPAALRTRIDQLRERLDKAYANGSATAVQPSGDGRWDGHWPAWKIVERAIDEYEGHLERSCGR